jgi:hypothetical protein
MQPITCDACRQPTLADGAVNYGSKESGCSQLCGRCFNETAASRLGMQGFGLMEAFEGWQFKLEFRDRSEAV